VIATVVLGFLVATQTQPPRPTDDELTAAVQAEHPTARILSQDFRESNRGGARIGCGLIDIDGHIEPVSVTAAWKEPPEAVIAINGVTAPRRAAHWDVSVNAPSRGDYDEDGDIDRTDRNYDVLKRRIAMMWCDHLEPPEGIVWALEPEPNPDPVRAARDRALARRATDLLLGRPAGD
jgi:hypothetical protein